MGFWKDGFSIDESKTSALIMSMFAVIGFAMYSYIKSGDITQNMLSLILAFIYAIAGVNVASSIGNAISGIVPRLPNSPTQGFSDKGQG